MLSNGLQYILRRSTPVLLAAAGLATTATAQGTFIAEDGILVVRIESAQPTGEWDLSTSTPGFLGEGYFRWEGPNLFNQPGQQGIFGFDFEIDTGGTWIFNLRNRHENPDPTEENDVWIRMDNGPWIKLFSNMPGSVGNWTWESRFDLSHSNQPQASYDLTPGAHRVEFSGRSFGFKMDRFHMYRPGTQNPFDPNRPESPRRLGRRYCGATVNSSGTPSRMDAYGSPFAADNRVTLECNSLPQNSLGYFLVSRQQGFVPLVGGSSGNLCIVGNIGRFAGAPLNSGASGLVELPIDLTALPQPNGAASVQPGETWNFQYWHRDTGPNGTTSNFSRALEVTFE